MSWVDEEYVVGITGKEPTQANIILGQIIVSIFSGVSDQAFEDEVIGTANLTNLKRAVAFQAVWLGAHPDVLEAMDVEGVSQDGLSAQYATANAHLLAPLAQRCISRLSWKRAPIRTGRSRRHRRALDTGNRDSAIRDDQFQWTPISHGGSQ